MNGFGGKVRLLGHGNKWLSNILRTFETLVREAEKQDWSRCRPYSEIPGPKPMPLLGNTWRFIPFIGIVRLKLFNFMLFLLCLSFASED